MDEHIELDPAASRPRDFISACVIFETSTPCLFSWFANAVTASASREGLVGFYNISKHDWSLHSPMFARLSLNIGLHVMVLGVFRQELAKCSGFSGSFGLHSSSFSRDISSVTRLMKQIMCRPR